jgi:hypothetical protein
MRYMTFHETYWAVVGAAAPVIALANAVSLGDSYRIGRFFNDLLDHPNARVKETADSFKVLARSAFMLGNGNFVIQAGIFVAALISLSIGSDIIRPLWFVSALEFYGLAVLVPINITAGRLQWGYDKFEAAMGQAGYTDTLTATFADILRIAAEPSVSKRDKTSPRPRTRPHGLVGGLFWKHRRR